MRPLYPTQSFKENCINLNLTLQLQFMKILNTTPNGLLLFCPNCKAYHLEFGNLFFRFSEEEMKEFRKYISAIDGPKYEAMNHEMPNRRKIFLRMPINGFHCTVNNTELKELQYLVNKTIKLPDIYNLSVFYKHDTCLN